MTVDIVTVIGARPQFVKAAAVSRALRGRARADEFMIHTGQHFDENMSAIFFAELGIAEPDAHLGIGGGSHGAMTGRQLEQVEQILLQRRPDWVLVYGDTNSTLAGALAAAKLHLPVAHVEAGLRSFNRRMPEEINRVMTDHLAELLFAPTERAVRQLAREGIDGDRVRLSGDVMYDAALYYGERAERDSRIMSRLTLDSGAFWLVTLHRAENTDDGERLRAAVDAFCQLAADRTLVWPLHPRTRAALRRHGLERRLADTPGVVLCEPLGYLDMVMLERHAALILTDSGGVQKEAYFYRVPCVTLRAETEWQELVDGGWNRLAAPSSAAAVIAAAEQALNAAAPADDKTLYGGGDAAERVVDALLERS